MGTYPVQNNVIGAAEIARNVGLAQIYAWKKQGNSSSILLPQTPRPESGGSLSECEKKVEFFFSSSSGKIYPVWGISRPVLFGPRRGSWRIERSVARW
jgi:hypothetical protein